MEVYSCRGGISSGSKWLKCLYNNQIDRDQNIQNKNPYLSKTEGRFLCTFWVKFLPDCHWKRFGYSLLKKSKTTAKFLFGSEGKVGTEIPNMWNSVWILINLLVKQEWSKSRGTTALHWSAQQIMGRCCSLRPSRNLAPAAEEECGPLISPWVFSSYSCCRLMQTPP